MKNEEIEESLPKGLISERQDFIDGKTFSKSDEELKSTLKTLVKEGFPNNRVRHFPSVMASSIHFIQFERLVESLNKENRKVQNKMILLMIIGIVIAAIQAFIAIQLYCNT